MEVGDVIYARAHTLRETQKRALISFVMFPLLSRRCNLIGVYERRDCDERKESEREGLWFVPIMQLCCLGGHGRSFQDPLSKSFLPLLFFLSCLSLPEECILYPIPPSLRWFLPASPPVLSISLSLTITVHILLSFTLQWLLAKQGLELFIPYMWYITRKLAYWYITLHSLYKNIIHDLLPYLCSLLTPCRSCRLWSCGQMMFVIPW